MNVQRGDLVACQLPNWNEFVVVYLACTRIGAVFNPIPITMRKAELKDILALCEPKLIFIADRFRNHHFINMLEQIEQEMEIPTVVVVRDSRANNKSQLTYFRFEELLLNSESDSLFELNVSGDDPAVILFSSGTESVPKGIVHTHNTILCSERSLIEVLHLTENDRVLMASPISHATGFYRGVNLPLLIGATTILMERFSAEGALKLISEEKCTFSMGATPFLYDIVHEMRTNRDKYNLETFRFFLCGGAPIPRKLAYEALDYGLRVLPVYGTTESSPHVVGRIEASLKMNIEFDGKVIPEIEVKIVDEHRNEVPDGTVGEEASRGPNVFIGYFKRPDLTEMYFDNEGWYYSGDLCVLENGYLRVVGRKKEIIIRGGQNISPAEVEEILLTHPKIEKVAIVGVPNERLGEQAHAVVVPTEGETLTFKEMIDFLDQKEIAKYKFPEYLHFVDDLPTTSSGKIQKYKLQDLIKNNQLERMVEK
jgi:acyl-CoA synthetase